MGQEITQIWKKKLVNKYHYTSCKCFVYYRLVRTGPEPFLRPNALNLCIPELHINIHNTNILAPLHTLSPLTFALFANSQSMLILARGIAMSAHWSCFCKLSGASDLTSGLPPPTHIPTHIHIYTDTNTHSYSIRPPKHKVSSHSKLWFLYFRASYSRNCLVS